MGVVVEWVLVALCWLALLGDLGHDFSRGANGSGESGGLLRV